MVEDCSKEVLFLHVRYTISFSIALKLYPALFDCAVHSMFKSILGSVIPSSQPTFCGFSLLENWIGGNGGQSRSQALCIHFLQYEIHTEFCTASNKHVERWEWGLHCRYVVCYEVSEKKSKVPAVASYPGSWWADARSCLLRINPRALGLSENLLKSPAVISA